MTIAVAVCSMLGGGEQRLKAAATWVGAPAPYAKELANRVVKEHPDMLDVIFHMTPPDATENFAVAAYTAKEQGLKSGEDDISVMKTRKPTVEVQKDGVRIGVLVPLHDRSSKTIGTLGLMYPYKTGEDEKKFLQVSEQIRDGLAKQIPSRSSLFKIQ